MLDNIYAGYNLTVITYGQSGSGKTYTITGDQSELGLVQHISKAIFDKKQKLEAENDNNQVTIKISYLEIYNEKLKDLLDPVKK